MGKVKGVPISSNCIFLFILHLMKHNRRFFIVDDDSDDQDLFIEAVNEVDSINRMRVGIELRRSARSS